MSKPLSTLISDINTASADPARNAFAVELIDHSIRSAEANCATAKALLMALSRRIRQLENDLATTVGRMDHLRRRHSAALSAGCDAAVSDTNGALDLLQIQQAKALARRKRLDGYLQTLRQSIDDGHKYLVDLRQGAIKARQLRRDAGAQDDAPRAGDQTPSYFDMQALIQRVLGHDDPFRRSDIVKLVQEELATDQGEDALNRSKTGGCPPGDTQKQRHFPPDAANASLRHVASPR